MTLIIQKPRFFLAIAKQKAHSFIMLGTYTQNTVEHLLCKVGKTAEVGKDNNNSCFLFSALFSEMNGRIADERIYRAKKGHKPISYQAYDINLNQYIEFIRTLEALQTKSKQFKCMKPTKINADSVHFESTAEQLFTPKSLEQSFLNSANRFSINKTCRHTAIKLIEETLHQPAPSSISSNFLNEFLCRTYLDFDAPSQDYPFYVLPAPPNTITQLDTQKRKIAEKLYLRMEQMLKIEPNSQQTQQKFTHLKELYEQVVGEHNNSIDELLHQIKEWKKQHWTSLNTLRVTYFWDEFIPRKTATLKTIEDIEKGLSLH